MFWAKALLVGGLVMLFAGFGLGVNPASTSVDGQTYACDSAIPVSWLVPGTPDPSSASVPQTDLERRVQATCQAVERRGQLLTWGALGLGSVLALAGWTAHRERRAPATVPSVSDRV